MLNINALSLFSSAGVAETYFEQHGIHVCVAAELKADRAKIYKHLYPTCEVFLGDLRSQDTFNSVISAARKKHCNLILATPPCQGMSKAGLKKKVDARNDLIVIAINAILELLPNFVIIENVPELLKYYIDYEDEWINIQELLNQKLGGVYNFNTRPIVNTMNYGIAQSRERCVLLLTKKTLGFVWEFPKPSDNIPTMRDAIGNLPSVDPYVTDITDEERAKLFPHFEEKKAKALTVSPWHCPPRHIYRHVIAMIHTAEGQSAMKNKIFFPALKDGTKTKGFDNTYRRQYWDMPAFTITMYTSRIGSQQNGHPGHPIVDSENEEERIWSDPRTMTIFEIMRLSSMPDNWNIPTNTSHNLVREILGEGVPPKLLEAAIIELENHFNSQKNDVKN